MIALQKNLKKAIDDYITAFEKKQDIEFEQFVDDSIIGIVVFADYYFNMSDIVLDINANQPKDSIFNWYNETIDAAMAEKQTINYLSWTKGMRYETNNII